jgi:4-hydroxy-2-oxoheptanedioate aldolase
MQDSVIAIMVEKRGCIDNLEEILSLDDIDMVQFGPCDYSLSIGRVGQWDHPEVKEAELKTIKTAVEKGKRPRVEIGPINYSKEDMKKYIELGVKDFHLPSDVIIMHQWIKQNAEILRELLK